MEPMERQSNDGLATVAQPYQSQTSAKPEPTDAVMA